MDLATKVRTAMKAVQDLCVESGESYLSVACFNRNTEPRNTDATVGDYYFRFEVGKGFEASYTPKGNQEGWMCNIDLTEYEIEDFKKPPVKRKRRTLIESVGDDESESSFVE